MVYAAGTNVPVEKSRAEIEGTLRRYGADGFRYGWSDQDEIRIEQIEFSKNGKVVRFAMRLPSKDEKRFGFTSHRPPQPRTPEARHRAWDQACRERWRALALCIKAKLEAVDSGITQFESEFLAQIVDPVTGRTIGQLFLPAIEKRYLEGPQAKGLEFIPEFDREAD